ncbi:MAG: uroporphyrinogen decarboxylase [Armatimonadetes bacterium]|nr:uroporphyrinogen decarboxylase [Armatimonadota bacterium]
MTGRERVFATLAGAPKDRVPFFLIASLYGAHLTGCPLPEYFHSGTAYGEGQAAVVERFDPDLVLGPFAVTKEGEAWGSTLRYSHKGAPMFIEPAAPSRQAIAGLAPPDIDSSPSLLYFREATRAIASAHGTDRVIAVGVLDPVDLPLMIMGIEGWLDTLLFHRADAQRLLDLCLQHFGRWANALLADGADLIIVLSCFMGPTLAPPELAEAVTLPVLRQALAQVQGPVMLHHGGSPSGAKPRLTAGLQPVIGQIMDARDNLAEARTILGDTAVLASGPEGPRLIHTSRESALAMCRAMLLDRRDDPRFVLGTTAADIEPQTPVEVVAALHDAVVEES